MTPSGILDIIVIIYYVPAFILSLLVVRKHGASRRSGWIALTLLSIFRLVGSACGIASIYSPSTGVIEASLILSNMGTISLLGATMGIIKRANQNMTERALPARMLQLTQAPTLVALILAIVGGVKTASSNPNERSDGETLTKVAIVLLLVVYLMALFLCVYTMVFKRYVLAGERRLLTVSVLALPFVLIRLIYAFCTAFRPTDPDFSILSTTNTAVIIRALMGILMEFIVVALYLWAGLTVDVSPERQTQAIKYEPSSGMGIDMQGSPSYQRGDVETQGVR